jgi:hypothetical protein
VGFADAVLGLMVFLYRCAGRCESLRLNEGELGFDDVLSGALLALSEPMLFFKPFS